MKKNVVKLNLFTDTKKRHRKLMCDVEKQQQTMERRRDEKWSEFVL